MTIEVCVPVGDGERIIIVTDFTYTRGLKAILNRAPEDCSPAEPAIIEDIEAHWEDTGLILTGDDWNAWTDEIEEACFEHIQSRTSECDESRDD